jgi:hypothetical protein
LSPASLIAITIAQVIAIAIVVAVAAAIALVAFACLPPLLPLPSLVSLVKPPPPPPPTLSFGWLLHFFNDWQPPKAWAPPISLFQNGSSFGAPSKGTSRVDCKPINGCLQQTHGESRHHDLGTWWLLPWQYGAKMLKLGWWWLILFLFVVWEPKTPEIILLASKCYSCM